MGKRNLPDGVYVQGEVEGVPVLFTADTGASKTVISSKVFDRIHDTKKPRLERTAGLRGAGGAVITKRGKAKFALGLGPVEIITEAVVADIEDDALLGYDVLMSGCKGPADILLSEQKIILDGVEVPCIHMTEGKKTRKVTVADDVVIPGNTEVILSVYVERTDDDDSSEQLNYVVEPLQKFTEKYPLLLASTLVDINKAVTCKIRVLDPMKTDVTLRQDAEIGKAEPVERIVSIFQEAEYAEETNNLNSIRRLQVNVAPVSSPEVGVKEAREDQVPDHLKQLFERSSEGRSEEEKRILAGILVKYHGTFSKDEWDLGLTHLAEHTINTGDAAPIKQRPRPVPIAHADEEKKAVEDLIKRGVIQKSTSAWASPIVLVRKTSGGIRPCVDYRKLNALVKQDGFPLPRVQDCLDAVASSSLFSSFDLTSGYFQIPLKKEDIHKSAFCCKYGLYEMTRMPFGLNNAAGTFQRTMELALQGLQWVTCLVYIDDIIVFGSDFQQHISRVCQVLDRMQDAGLKLKPEKCNMLRTEVTFLGHVVSKDGVKPDPNNVAKIVQWPKPQNARQVKQFIATGSYYRRFVKNFAKIVRPLVELTKKEVKFRWAEDCEEAFERIKSALISPEVMGYPLNDGEDFFLDVDASGIGIGGVLSQRQEGRERVIAYASRAMNKAEKNYCITEAELLAVVYFIQYFRQYLLGRRFVVRSDHQALVWLFKLREPSGKIARWIEILAQYDFTIEYRPGTKQAHCDALSRCEAPRDCTCSDVDMMEPLKCGPCRKCCRRAEIMGFPQPDELSEGTETKEAMKHADPGGSARAIITDEQVAGPSSRDQGEGSNWFQVYRREDIISKQEDDPDVAPILLAKRLGERPSDRDMSTASPASRHYWVIWEALAVQNGVLVKKTTTGVPDERPRMIVPRCLQKEVMWQHHDSVTAGHMGVKRTKFKVAHDCYWYNMREDISLYIKRCDTCAADKVPPRTPKAPMGHIRTGAPWDVLAIDYLGPFPRTSKGNKYIMVMTDHFSKYVEVIPVPDQTAEECADKILNEFIARWGAPLRIHSDQGGTFESRVFKEMCRVLNIRKSRTSPKNPRGNGLVERFNRTLVKMIKAYLVDKQDEWDQNLGCIAGAYRATPNESTKLTPNLLCMGREVTLPADLLFSECHLGGSTPDSPLCEHVEGLREQMYRAHCIARKHLDASAKRSKEVYDANVVQHNFGQGDLVWCLNESRKVGVMPKLQKMYDGPFVVKRRVTPINFVLQLDQEGTERLIHHNKIKKYEGENPPRWAAAQAKRLKKK